MRSETGEFWIWETARTLLWHKNRRNYITYNIPTKVQKTRRWSPTPLLRLQVVKLGFQEEGSSLRTAWSFIHSLQTFAHIILMHLLIDYCIYNTYIVPKYEGTRCNPGEGRGCRPFSKGKSMIGTHNLHAARRVWQRCQQREFPRSPPHLKFSGAGVIPLDHNAQDCKNLCIHVLSSYISCTYIKWPLIGVHETIYWAQASPQ